MSGTVHTINQIAHRRRKWQNLLHPDSNAPALADEGAPALVEIVDFGTNPGNLRMLVHVPVHKGGASRPTALVVALHGCTQTAASYDRSAGWTQLAAQLGFVVLLPEQKCENNPNLCFNWFVEEDITRNHGEVASIRQMIAQLAQSQDLGPDRIFITGLSAGGAMANAMLATYPETFAAGAIVAGLPFQTATSLREALQSMADGRQLDAWEWGDFVRSASGHCGPWPRVSIWHGDADTIVNPSNAQSIAAQWRNVHAVPGSAALNESFPGVSHRAWGMAAEPALVECWLVADLAHAIALSGEDPEAMIGKAGPLAHDVGIASTLHIAEFFGLEGQAAPATALAADDAGDTSPPAAYGNGVLSAARQLMRAILSGRSA